MTAASILVSAPDHFTVQRFDGDLEEMQKLVGGYVAPIYHPDNAWHLYVDEDADQKQAPVNVISSVVLNRFVRTANPFNNELNALLGNVVWLGPVVMIGDEVLSEEHSTPMDLVELIAGFTVRATDSSRPITIIRRGNDVWVFDTPTGGPVQQIMKCVTDARLAMADGGDHGMIEVWPNVTKNKWVEIRVEIMDDFRIDLHDMREDRSYG